MDLAKVLSATGTQDSQNKKWENAHEGWWAQDFNRANMYDDESREAFLKGVPLEWRDTMLPLVSDGSSTEARENPSVIFFRKLEYDRLASALPPEDNSLQKVLAGSSPATVDIDSRWKHSHASGFDGSLAPDDGFAKFFDEFLDGMIANVGRTKLPSNDGGRLAKKTDMTYQCEKLVNDAREFCVGDEEHRLEKALECLDHALIVELVGAIITREKLRRAA